MKKFIIGLIFVSTVLLIGGVGMYVYSTFFSKPNYSATNSPTEVLKKENPDFNKANFYRKQGKYSEALTSYKTALGGATDSVQEAQIKFNIGLMLEFSGQYVPAIQMFKEVAANPAYTNIIKAYSVQEMGRMYHTYYGSTKIITDEIFKDAPYKDFMVGDEKLAYRKLFEYASSFYPIALTESFIANSYSGELFYTLKGASTTPEGKTAIASASLALLKANQYMEQVKNDPTEAALFGEIYSREALVVGQLAASNVPGYTNEQAEALHKKALSYAGVNNVLPGNFFVFKYALFLVMNFGQERAGDLQKLLAVFSVANSAQIDKNVVYFYKIARTNPVLTTSKEALVRMGTIDPAFKAYLLTLGWVETDFVRAKAD